MEEPLLNLNTTQLNPCSLAARMRRLRTWFNVVLLATMVVAIRPVASNAQDDMPRPGPAKPVDAATQAWCDAVAKEPLGTVGLPPAVRYNLVVSDRYLYFTWSDYPNGAPPAVFMDPRTGEILQSKTDSSDEDEDEQLPFVPRLTGRVLAAPPEPSRRVLMRVNRTGEARPETLGEVGRYPLAFFLFDSKSKLACIRQHEDTNGDGQVTDADARGLWVCSASGTDWRKVYQGSPYMSLAGVVERTQEALLVEPTEQAFESRILRVSLVDTPAVPKDFTRGLYVECIDSSEEYVVVARATVRTADEPRMKFPGVRPMGLDAGESNVERAIFNPPNHVLVPLTEGKPESMLLAGEEWLRVAFVLNQIAYFEVMMIAPTLMSESGHPTWQAHHTLGYLDIKNQTRIPISSNMQFDDQLLGVCIHGTLYLHNTNINRHLTIYTGENRHAVVRELSPLTCEFVLAPDCSTLYFLEYAPGTVAPFDPYRTPTVIRSLRLEN